MAGSTTRRPLAMHLVLAVAFVILTGGAGIVALVLSASIGPCGRAPVRLFHIIELKGSMALVGVAWTTLPAVMANVAWRDASRRWLAAPWAVLAVLTAVTTAVIMARAEVSPLCL